MDSPFIGQVCCVPYTFAPLGWASCQGQLMSIADNPPLYQLIGTTYGGDGVTTFALPDLRGRVALCSGQGPDGTNYPLGQTLGIEVVWLTAAQTPAHSHNAAASGGPPNATTPNKSYIAPAGNGAAEFAASSDGTVMNPAMVQPTPAASQNHDNRQPYLVLNWIIALEGIYPSQG
jgi:microcystin-dependent protein